MIFLQWSKPNEGQPIHGRVFRITFRYEYKNPGNNSNGVIVDCIMLKSKGTVQSELAIKSITDYIT